MALVTYDQRRKNTKQLSLVAEVQKDDSAQFGELDVNRLRLLFIEGADQAPEVEGFNAPVVGKWQVNKIFSEEALNDLFQNPHNHVPRLFYSLNPNMAMKLAIQYVFQILYDIEDMGMVIKRLFRTDPKMFGSFKVFYRIVTGLWSKEQVQLCPLSLGEDFFQQVILGRVENLHSTGHQYLHLTKPMRKKLGLELSTVVDDRSAVSDMLGQCTRSHPLTVVSSYFANQCSICTSDFDTKAELMSHLTECLTQFEVTSTGPDNDLAYKCTQCDTEKMNLEDMVSHLYTFCTLNIRSVCPFCNGFTKRCSCSKIRIEQMRQVQNMITDSVEYDLVHKKNVIYLSLFLENHKRLNMKTLGETNTGTFGQTEIDIILQSEQGQVFIMNRTSRGLMNVSVDMAMSGLEADGIELGKIVPLHPGAHVDLQVNTAPKVCPLCWQETAGDPKHELTHHPRCFCKADPYMSPSDLIEHYQQHVLKNVRCPDCNTKFETLMDLVAHFKDHVGKNTVKKPACDNDLGMAECLPTELDGYAFFRHLLIFHVEDNAHYKALITQMPHIVKGQLSCELVNKPGTVKAQHESKPGATGLILGGESTQNNNPSMASATNSVWGEKTLLEAVKNSAKNVYKCPNQLCMTNNVSFQTKQQLDNHINQTHWCQKPGCNYINADETQLWAHTLNHLKSAKGQHGCYVCEDTFPDPLSLRQHMDMCHYLTCTVCGDQSYTTRGALNLHMETCEKAALAPASKVRHATPVEGGRDTPLLMIVDALANPSSTTKDDLQKIKSVILKQTFITQHIESHKSGNKSFMDLPRFKDPTQEPPLNIPNSRLKGLPRFNPQDEKPLANYMSFFNLVSELNFLAIEYRSTEQQYISILMQQYSCAAKIQLKSLLNITQTFQGVPLERIFEVNRCLFYDVDLATIYAQASNLPILPGESILQFFARASSVTRLGSFYLDDPQQMENFRTSNLRLQFLMAAGKKFSEMIKTREVQQNIVYCPPELLKIFLEWVKTEKPTGAVPVATINRLTQDVGVDSFTLGGPDAMGQRPNGARKKVNRQRPAPETSRSRKGKQDRLRSADRVRQTKVNPPQPAPRSLDGPRGRLRPESQQKPRDGQRPPRYSQASLQKRRALNIVGDQVICFLCGQPHFARYCSIYPGVTVQDAPCGKCNYYHETSQCKSRPSNGRN